MENNLESTFKDVHERLESLRFLAQKCIEGIQQIELEFKRHEILKEFKEAIVPPAPQAAPVAPGQPIINQNITAYAQPVPIVEKTMDDILYEKLMAAGQQQQTESPSISVKGTSAESEKRKAQFREKRKKQMDRILKEV